MSDEIPECNKAKQCIDCKCNNVCMRFDDLKKLSGMDIVLSLQKEKLLHEISEMFKRIEMSEQ